MTDLELIDKVTEHLLKQGRRAMIVGGCVYRDNEGGMCAAGCLIEDEHYSVDIEGATVSSSGKVQEALFKSGVDRSQIALVRTLQSIHDSHPVCEWQYYLAAIREDYAN